MLAQCRSGALQVLYPEKIYQFISKLTMKNRNYINDAILVSLLITLNLFQTFFRLEQIACSMPIWRVWAHKTSETHPIFQAHPVFPPWVFFFVFLACRNGTKLHSVSQSIACIKSAETADMVTFTEETPNANLHFLCSVDLLI